MKSIFLSARQTGKTLCQTIILRQKNMLHNILYNKNLPAAQAAYKIAVEAHKGQVRNKNGEPYINHVERVAIGTLESYSEDKSREVENLFYLAATDRLYVSDLDILLSVSFLHDSIEDQPNLSLEEVEDRMLYVTSQCSSRFPYTERMVRCIDNLTKKPKGEETYDSYIQRVASDEWSIRVKIADLKDNLRDLKPGDKKDKYELSLYFLNLCKQKL